MKHLFYRRIYFITGLVSCVINTAMYFIAEFILFRCTWNQILTFTQSIRCNMFCYHFTTSCHTHSWTARNYNISKGATDISESHFRAYLADVVNAPLVGLLKPSSVRTSNTASAASIPLFIAVWVPLILATFMKPALQPTRHPPGNVSFGTHWTHTHNRLFDVCVLHLTVATRWRPILPRKRPHMMCIHVSLFVHSFPPTVLLLIYFYFLFTYLLTCGQGQELVLGQFEICLLFHATQVHSNCTFLVMGSAPIRAGRTWPSLFEAKRYGRDIIWE